MIEPDDEELIQRFKLTVALLISSILDIAVDYHRGREFEGELLRTIMAEMLMLAATIHRNGGGSDASFLVMAQDSIELMQNSGATKQ